MRRFLILGLLAVPLFGRPATCAPAANSPDRENERLARTVLGSEPRLREKVCLAVQDRPLGELLFDLAKQFQVPLAASRDTADDRVTLFVRERPASEVLTLLARHLDFQWSRNGRKLELTQNLAAKRREQALRDRDREAQVAGETARMAALSRLAALAPERLEERRQALEARLAAPGLTSAEREQLAAERRQIASLRAGSGGRAAVAVYQALAAQQLRQLQGARRCASPPPTAPCLRRSPPSSSRSIPRVRRSSRNAASLNRPTSVRSPGRASPCASPPHRPPP